VMSGKVGRMAKSRPRQQRRTTVGGREGAGGWPAYFAWAVLAVVVSFIVLIIVAADSLGGGGGAAGPGTEPPATAVEETATNTPATQSPGTGEPTATPTNEPGPDGSIVVACGDVLAPLDKQHRLPADCVPGDLVELPAALSAQGTQYLRSETLAALREMFDAAREEQGFLLVVNSSYRSYQTQADTYNYWVQTYGKDQADRTSARPGHSEHQLGTTADVGARGLYLEAFTGSPEAAWLAENAWKYGFIVSYPEGKEDVTGYAYEPWHVRYVGKDVAAQVHASGLTLREYLLR